MAQDINLYEEKDCHIFKKINSKNDLKALDNINGILIDTAGNEKECRRIIDSLKNKKLLIGVQSFDNEFNRRVLETMKINFLFNPENAGKKDTLKQRDSGINHVIAKIAKKKKIMFLIDLNELKKLPKEKKIEKMSRIIQNIKICRKEKCKIGVISFAKNKKELFSKKQKESFLYSVGASSTQIKDSFNL